MLYMYKKSTGQTPPRRFSLPHKFIQLLPTILVTFGSILVANVAWPIIQYNLFISPSLNRPQLLSPINQSETAFFNSTDPITAASQPSQTSIKTIEGKEPDYTNAQNWFPTAEFSTPQPSKITHYTIDIPKVEIYDAIVEIGGTDLTNHLIQYPGTSNPGQPGSAVIFGHSVLRQFYNPSTTNPRRYLSIFSKIMTLDQGDEIFVDYDGIRYRYTLIEKAIVSPQDVFILQQRHDRRQLKLITCVPEGTYLRRGVIIAELQDIE